MRIGTLEIDTKKIIVLLSGLVILFNLYCLLWFPPPPYLHRGIFMFLFIVIIVLLNPAKGKISRIFLTIFTLMALCGVMYAMIFQDKLTSQNYTARSSEIIMFVIFAIGISAVLTRIAAGSIILGIIVVGVLYFALGQYIPGYFGHKDWPITYIVTQLYTDLDLGAFGSFTEMAARLLSIYMLFAALLITAGLGDVFTAVSQWIAGNATGGPAKVSVISSALFGMISGSAVANVVATGSFTIPLMKKVGYEPKMAATVESLASSGGILMPPIMGIGAFIMADLLGISYFKVCVAAIIPVFLWYFSVYMIVHHYALRHKIVKWRPPRDEVIAVLKKKSHLILAVFVLLAVVAYTGSAEQAALFGVISLFLLTFVTKETRLNKAKISAVLAEYANMFAPLFVLMVCLGMFVAAFMASGVHIKIGQVLMGGVDQWYFQLLIVFALVFALGMAVPAAAAYVAAVVVVAPILTGTGTPPLVIHMFVFYLSVLAPITPPTAPASFAGARIAGADMLSTAFYAAYKSLPLWIVPFTLYRKNLLFEVGTPLSVLGMEVAILCAGIYIFILGVEGYFCSRLNTVQRVLAIVIGLMIVQPISDLFSKIFFVAGVLLVIYLFILYRIEKKKASRVIATTETGG